METNKKIIEKATVTTATLTNGILKPDQSKQFIKQTFEATDFGKLVRHEMRKAKSGEIDKIGIASRIIRAKTENNDDGYRANPIASSVPYQVVDVRLPWEITEETLRENIEGQNFEKTVTDLMTAQLGVDLLDLYFNSDTATASSDPDYDFLKLNDGWLKLMADGHIEDRTSKDGGKFTEKVFYDALNQMPNKYNNGKLRWIMSPAKKQEWQKFLVTQALNGGNVPASFYDAPAGIPIEVVPTLANNKIALTDPKNLAVINTYNTIIRKTNEGKEAIMQDKRFYVIHLDFDVVIEELDATCLITGLL